jgi:translation initiation factor IF-2
MSDTKDPGEKTRAPSKTLSLKRSETGTVRQSFSHGRSKTVVVEVKRGPRSAAKPGLASPAKMATAAAAPAPAAPEKKAPVAPAKPSTAPRGGGMVLRTLTDEERDARGKALIDAREREEQERRDAVEEAKRRAERDAVEKTERDASEARKKEEESRRHHDEETKKKAEQEARKRFGEDGTTAPRPGAGRVIVADEEEDSRPRRPGAKAPPPPRPTRTTEVKQRGRLTLTNALSSGEERQRSTASFRRRTQRITGHRDEPKERWRARSSCLKRSRFRNSRAAWPSARSMS